MAPAWASCGAGGCVVGRRRQGRKGSGLLRVLKSKGARRACGRARGQGPWGVGGVWSPGRASGEEGKGRQGRGRGSREGAELAEASGLEPGREEAGGARALRRAVAAGPKGEDGVLHGPGIEPGPPAWQARILPLNHPCTDGSGPPTVPNSGPGQSQGQNWSRAKPGPGPGPGSRRGQGQGRAGVRTRASASASASRVSIMLRWSRRRPGGPERRLQTRLERLGAAAAAETGGARHRRTEADSAPPAFSPWSRAAARHRPAGVAGGSREPGQAWPEPQPHPARAIIWGRCS